MGVQTQIPVSFPNPCFNPKSLLQPQIPVSTPNTYLNPKSLFYPKHLSQPQIPVSTPNPCSSPCLQQAPDSPQGFLSPTVPPSLIWDTRASTSRWGTGGTQPHCCDFSSSLPKIPWQQGEKNHSRAANIPLSNVGVNLVLFCTLKSLSLLLRLTLASPLMLDLILGFSNFNSVSGNVLSGDALAPGINFPVPACGSKPLTKLLFLCLENRQNVFDFSVVIKGIIISQSHWDPCKVPISSQLLQCWFPVGCLPGNLGGWAAFPIQDTEILPGL